MFIWSAMWNHKTGSFEIRCDLCASFLLEMTTHHSLKGSTKELRLFIVEEVGGVREAAVSISNRKDVFSLPL